MVRRVCRWCGLREQLVRASIGHSALPVVGSTSTNATEGWAARSVTNSGPRRRPASRRGSNRAVRVCQTITSRAPPLRVTTARELAVSRSVTFSDCDRLPRPSSSLIQRRPQHPISQGCGRGEDQLDLGRVNARTRFAGIERARSRTSGSPTSQPWSRH